MCGISSIYKEDCMDNAATVATRAISDKIDCINSIKVFTQNADYEPNNNF
jgi:hypothetical protein